MSIPEYQDVTNIKPEHNQSAQHDVTPNPDPALDTSHEHHHAHLHHDAHAEQGRHDEVVYSKGTTFEKGVIPDQQPHHHRKSHQGEVMETTQDVDTENGLTSDPSGEEEDPRHHSLSRFYAKYRIFAHLFIWLFFTGSVQSFLSLFSNPDISLCF